MTWKSPERWPVAAASFAIRSMSVASHVSASSATKDTVTLTGVGGAGKALRYAWEDSPSVFTGTGPAVFNGEGLPATPSLLNITAAV